MSEIKVKDGETAVRGFIGIEVPQNEEGTYSDADLSRKDKEESTDEVQLKDLRAKTLHASGETLDEMLTRFEKTLNRHERDLTKLRPVTMQAPSEANTEADVLSCITDLIQTKMRASFRQLFVTRSEFMALEELLPDATQHFLSEIAKM